MVPKGKDKKVHNIVEVINRQRRFNINTETLRNIAEYILDICKLYRVELSIAIVNNRRIRELNSLYRGIRGSTDVLAFPLNETTHTGFTHLGDVVISIEKASIQAKESGHSLEKELYLLLTHGILHLLGYDHEKSPEEAKKMRDMEKRVLGYTEKTFYLEDTDGIFFTP